jgi:polyisoprenoid-binding protein YceI
LRIKYKLLLILLVAISFSFVAKTDIWYTRSAKVTFFSSAPVEDIKANNNQVTVVFNQSTGDINVQIAIKSFKFKNKTMQEHFNENYMESDKYPYANYKGKINGIEKINFTTDTTGNFIKPATYNVTTKGNMTIHGVTKEVVTNGKLILKGSQAIIKTNFDVLLVDYNIEKPSIMAMKIADKIEVTLESVCKNK